jgi:hypothetical protein
MTFVPNPAYTTRCAVACDTPVDAAKAAMLAAVLPPARFAAASPASSRLTLIPADAASAVSWDRAGDLMAAAWLALDLQALAAHACGGAGLPDGEPDPDANAAVGTAIAAAVMTPAMARRWCRTNMGRSSPRMGSPKCTDGAQDQPSKDLKET